MCDSIDKKPVHAHAFSVSSDLVVVGEQLCMSVVYFSIRQAVLTVADSSFQTQKAKGK